MIPMRLQPMSLQTMSLQLSVPVVACLLACMGPLDMDYCELVSGDELEPSSYRCKLEPNASERSA